MALLRPTMLRALTQILLSKLRHRQVAGVWMSATSRSTSLRPRSSMLLSHVFRSSTISLTSAIPSTSIGSLLLQLTLDFDQAMVATPYTSSAITATKLLITFSALTNHRKVAHHARLLISRSARSGCWTVVMPQSALLGVPSDISLCSSMRKHSTLSSTIRRTTPPNRLSPQPSIWTVSFVFAKVTVSTAFTATIFLHTLTKMSLALYAQTWVGRSK